MKRISSYRIVSVLFLIAINWMTGFAQLDNPPGGTGGGLPVGGEAGVPLDGGVIALLLGGAAMLYQQFVGFRKRKG